MQCWVEISLWETDAADQILEVRVGAQAVEYGLNFEMDHQIIAFFKSFFQLFKCTLLVANPNARLCHQRWRHGGPPKRQAARKARPKAEVSGWR
jgi:hypothetical protein